MFVLGIETSCDETGAALYHSNSGILAQALHSQIDLHKKYGGVIPELASRNHIKFLIPLLTKVIDTAQITLKDLSCIAYTAGPGLVGALLTGACFAKSLGYSLNCPTLAINHLEAHILVTKLTNPTLQFPFLALLISGGHTQLIEVKDIGNYALLGETLDDAIGEAFDKTAKLIGLDYPGGPQLASLADQNIEQDPPIFPRPMYNKANLDFSFSGLKTHALRVWNNSNKTDIEKVLIAKAFQEAVIDICCHKIKKALINRPNKTLVVAGGVSANLALRKALSDLITQMGGKIYFPKLEHCTDNGVMVAYTGFLHFKAGKKDPNDLIEVKPKWPFGIERTETI